MSKTNQSHEQFIELTTQSPRELDSEALDSDQEEDEVTSRPPEITPHDADASLACSPGPDAPAATGFRSEPTNQTPPLERLAAHEEKRCAFRWANLDYMPHRILHLLTTFRWMRSHGDPSKDLGTIRRSYFREEFLEGFLLIAGQIIKIGILLLVLVQFANAVSFRDVFELLKGGDQRALTIALYGAAKSKAFRSSLASLLALPFIVGVVRGIVGYLRVEVEQGEQNPRVQEAYRHLEQEVPAQAQRSGWKHLWHDGVRWFIPLHPVSRSVITISRALRWDARLDPLLRQKAQTALINLFETSHGFTKVTTGYELVRIIDSIHLAPVNAIDDEYVLLGDGLSSPTSPTNNGHTSGPTSINTNGVASDISNGQSAITATEAHLFNRVLKERAVTDVMNFAGWSDEKWGTSSVPAKVALLTGFAYGRYLQWWIGLSPTTKESTAFWTFKITKLAYSLLLLRTVYFAFRDYINCPEKPGITFTGIAPWAGKFDATCLAATINEFNRFPGQDAATLIKLLPEFYLAPDKKRSFTLDLRDKGLNAATIASLIRGFADQGYVITSLQLAGNIVGADDDQGATGMMEFAQALSRLKRLKVLDLSRNRISASCDNFNPTGLEALGEAFSTLESLETLDLSENSLGLCDHLDPRGTEATGRGLGGLSNLKQLSLANNRIGHNDKVETRGTIAFGNGLSTLTRLSHLNCSHMDLGLYDCEDSRGTEAVGLGLASISSLRVLDLSWNKLSECKTTPNGLTAIASGLTAQKSLRELNLGGNTLSSNVEGTLALVHAIQALEQLSRLDLSINRFGSQDSFDSGITEALAEALGHLSELESLSLQGTSIGAPDATNASGTVAIAKGLGKCVKLTTLDLSDNQIGQGDQYFPEGTMELASALRQLTRLQVLSLAANSIGKWDYMYPHGVADGTIAIVQALGDLRSLTSLDLSKNALGRELDESSSLVAELAHSLGLLTRLRELRLLPNEYLSSSMLARFQEAVSKLPTPISVPSSLISAEDIDAYFDRIPPSQTRFTFSDAFFAPIEALWDASEAYEHFFERLAQFDVRHLDLSRNDLAEFAPGSMTAIANGLARLTHLVTLDLSGNGLGYPIFVDDGFIALGNALAQLTKLQYLNLADNGLGLYEEVLPIVVGQLNPPELVSLDLSHNWIGGAHAEDIEAVRQLFTRVPNLQFLGLSDNAIGSSDDVTLTTTLLEGIASLTQLRVLNLTENTIGSKDAINPAGSVALGEAVGQLTQLRLLNLSDNSIGQGTAEGELGIVSGITKLKHLCSLDLSYNMIGSSDDRAPRMLIDYLPAVSSFNIKTMQNISWTESAQKISEITAQLLRAKCEDKMCFGVDITSEQGMTCDARVAAAAAASLNPFLTHSASGIGFTMLVEESALYDSVRTARTSSAPSASVESDVWHELRDAFIAFMIVPLVLLVVVLFIWRMARKVRLG